MGRDKAMLVLEGKTLLARSVEMLRAVSGLQSAEGRVHVTICGEREALEGADRAIADRYPECGPLGGIEAALRDLASSSDADWAFFIPVDMPLLSAEFIDGLLASWERQGEFAMPTRACFVELEGVAQPLVSLVHRSVLELVQASLEVGAYKVVPVLQSAGAYRTSFMQEAAGRDQQDGTAANGSRFVETSARRGTSVKRTMLGDEAKETAQSEFLFRNTFEQFINVNIEADLINVATLLRQRGSNT